MKLKALTLALFVAGLGASYALADDGGTGTTTGGTATGSTRGKDCRALELKGTFVSAAATSFVMNVAKANHGGNALEGTAATIALDARTRVRFEGVGSFAPKAGDRVTVVAVRCASAPTTLTAAKVDVRGAKKAEESKQGDDSGK